jgi:deoxyadenosine/deoxycytidine kinase
MHIAVAGNIGSGKTTLTRLLSKSFGWQAQYEEVDYNPYLSDFYNDMQRWAFNLQIYFLNTRFKGIVDIQNSNVNVIQHRTIYEDAQIFAANLHTMGLLSTRDFENYKSLFSLMISLVKPPDLLIYLKSSIPNLVSQIQKRGREYESSIRIDYLQGLNERYEEWIESYNHGKKLIINVDELKFEDNPKDLSTIIDMINGELNGLFL